MSRGSFDGSSRTSGVYTLSHARAHLATLIRDIHQHGPIRIGAHRKAQAVLLSAEDYDQLRRDAGRTEDQG